MTDLQSSCTCRWDFLQRVSIFKDLVSTRISVRSWPFVFMDGLLGIVSEFSEENGHLSALISLFLPEAEKAGET